MPQGKIAWGRSEIGGDPIVAVLTEQVSDAHLAGLRQDGVSYIFAGERELDLGLALEILNRELGIERLLLEGGGGSNGSFLRAGLIDEISLAICPAVDGAKGAPSIFNSSDGDAGVAAPIRSMTLGEQRGAGGRRGLAPLSAAKPLMPSLAGGMFMRNVRQLNVIRLLTFSMLLLILPATSWAQHLPPTAEQMAKTYGLDLFGQIEGIRYTFNAEFPGVKLSRTWEWNPKTDTVAYEGKDKEGSPVKVSYQRSQLGSQSDAVQNEIDPAFVNDQYWLLFPFHVAWDGGATITDEGMHKLPLGSVPLNGSW